MKETGRISNDAPLREETKRILESIRFGEFTDALSNKDKQVCEKTLSVRSGFTDLD